MTLDELEETIEELRVGGVLGRYLHFETRRTFLAWEADKHPYPCKGLALRVCFYDPDLGRESGLAYTFDPWNASSLERKDLVVFLKECVARVLEKNLEDGNPKWSSHE